MGERGTEGLSCLTFAMGTLDDMEHAGHCSNSCFLPPLRCYFVSNKRAFSFFLMGEIVVFFLDLFESVLLTYPLRHLPCGDALRVRLDQELNMVVVDPEKT